jgi:restriction system protein
MYGLLAHYQADAEQVATLGGFTYAGCGAVAERKPIELMEGPTLLGMMRAVQAIRVEVTQTQRPTESVNGEESPSSGEVNA